MCPDPSQEGNNKTIVLNSTRCIEYPTALGGFDIKNLSLTCDSELSWLREAKRLSFAVVPSLARLAVVVLPSIEGAVDIPKLYIRVCADNKLKKRRKTTRKKSVPLCPLNTSPQVNI